MSKTLSYMQALGCEPYKILNTGEHGDLKKWASGLTDYEIMYYHCKVLKMPLKTFDKKAIIDYMTYQAIFEYCQELEEIEEEAKNNKMKDQARRETLQKVYKAVIIYAGVLVLFVLALCLGLVFWI